MKVDTPSLVPICGMRAVACQHELREQGILNRLLGALVTKAVKAANQGNNPIHGFGEPEHMTVHSLSVPI